MIYLILLLFIYIGSIQAINKWESYMKPELQSIFIDNKDKYIPIMNTIIAIRIWIDFNPLK